MVGCVGLVVMSGVRVCVWIGVRSLELILRRVLGKS